VKQTSGTDQSQHVTPGSSSVSSSCTGTSSESGTRTENTNDEKRSPAHPQQGGGGDDELLIHKMDLDSIDKTVFTTVSGVLFLGIRAFAYPSVLVKTLMQTDPKLAKETSSLRVYQHVVKQDGFRGLFRGFAPSLLNTGLRQIYLLMYERMRTDIKTLNDKYRIIQDNHIDLFRDSVSGFAASVVYQVISNPIDIVVQRMMVLNRQTIQSQYLSHLATQTGPPPRPWVRWGQALSKAFPSVYLTRDIYKNEGIRAFYTGFVSSTLQYSLSSAIWWGTFTYAMDHLVPLLSQAKLTRHRKQEEPDPIIQPTWLTRMRCWLNGTKAQPCRLSELPPSERVWREHPWAAQHLAAFSAGAASVMFTNPLDVIRTRLMVTSRAGDGATMRSVFRQTIRDDGWIGLFRGVVPRTIAFAPVSVMTMSVLQVSKLLGFAFMESPSSSRSGSKSNSNV